MELKNRRCYLVGLFGSGCSIFFSGIIHSNKQASEIPSNKALFQKRMKLYIQNIFPIINFSVQSHCTINWTICPNYCIFFWLVGTELNYPSRVTNCQTIDQSNSNLEVRTACLKNWSIRVWILWPELCDDKLNTCACAQ